MHRKLGKLMQLGGHVELLENPWQAVAHEIAEESGYSLDQLTLLQPQSKPPTIRGTTLHPTPAVTLTFKNSVDHFHTDLSYAFAVDQKPTKTPHDGESKDLRWVTLDDYRASLERGEGIEDVYDIYSFIIDELIHTWKRVATDEFSLQNPDHLSF